MTYVRIGHPPRLAAPRHGWVAFHAKWMLAVCGVGVAGLVVLLMVVDALTL